MIRKLLFIVLLVIILVSLSWFSSLRAQDLSSLTAAEKAALKEKLSTYQESDTDPYHYQTPPIFDADEERLSDLTGTAEPQECLADKSQLASKESMEFEQLAPFGMELFRSSNENDPPTDIPSANDYILGPGDNVIIYLWGRVEKQFNLTLDREGKVFIPQVGELIAWGLTLERFVEHAQKQFSKVYTDFDLTVSLGKIRSVRIFVAGEVQNPGAYTVSSLTSLFNALYLAGGPNEMGSMRTIQLMREGKPEAEFDLYNLLLRGDNSSDIRLQTGDVVFVPVTGPRVAIRGEVRRSAIYELKGEETAADLLALAGNPTAEAHLERVMLERVSSSDEWTVLDLNLSGPEESTDNLTTLEDGDRMTVYSVFQAKKNIVSVQGQVKHAGYYERGDSHVVSDLIKRAQLKPYDVYFDRADLFRRYPDRRVEIIPVNIGAVLAGDPSADLPLQDRDSLYVYSIDEVEWQKHVYIEGEVKSPGEYPLYEGMSAEDLIFLAGSYKRGALRHQIEIARVDSLGEVSIFHVNPNPDEPAMVLQEDDHVYVRQIPEWQQNRTVTVEGEVRFPGKYSLSSRKETLHELLQRVGGFTANAFPTGTMVERLSIHEGLERLQVPRIIEKSTPITEDSLGQLKHHSTVEFDSRSMNRLIIDMDKILATKGRDADIVLEPGDRIMVPTIPSGISVIGAVGANGTIKYLPEENVRYYVERAGNFTRQADKKETRLVRATGEVISGRGILRKKVGLGDVVIVPTKIEKDKNWLKTITTALSAATGVLTSVYIVSKL